jgi:PAS domain S-box-containing protein
MSTVFPSVYDSLNQIHQLFSTHTSETEMIHELSEFMCENTPARFFAFLTLNAQNKCENFLHAGDRQQAKEEEICHEIAAVLKNSSTANDIILLKKTGKKNPMQVDWENESVVVMGLLNMDGQLHGAIMAIYKTEVNFEISFTSYFRDLGRDLSCVLNKKKYIRSKEALLEELPIGILHLSAKLKIKYANKAYFEITGKKPEDIYGKSGIWVSRKFLNRENLITVIKQARQLIQSKDLEFELDYLNKRLQIITRFNKHSNEFVVVLKDITEQKHLLNEVQENKEKFKFLSNSAFEGVIVHKNGIVADANDSFCKLIGLSKDQVIGRNIFDNLTPESQQIAKDNIQREYAKPYVVSALRNDGSMFWAEVESKNVMLNDELLRISAIRDVSERIIKEEELNKAYRSLDEAQEIGKMGSWSIDLSNGLVHASKQAKRIYGFDLDATLTLQKIQQIPLNTYRKLLDRKLEQLIQGIDEYDIEYEIQHQQSGEIRQVRSRAKYDAQRNMVSGIIQDVTELNAIEEEVHKFKRVVDEAQFGMALALMNGTLIYVNDYMANIHGYKPEELVNKKLNIFHNQEQLKDVKKLNDKVIQQGAVERQELMHMHKDGTVFPMMMGVSLIKNKKGIPVYMAASAFDIRAQKAAEKHIIDSENRFKMLSKATFEAIFFSEKGICTDQNETAKEMFGYALEEAIGKPGTNWIIPEDREKVTENMMKGVTTPYEVTALRKDGTTFPCEIQGRLLERSGNKTRITALRDISLRKKFESEVIKSEQMFRSIFDNKGTATLLLDSKSNISMANTQCYELTSYSVSELQNGMNWSDLAHPEDLEAFNNMVEMSFTGKLHGIQSYKARIIGKNKEIKYVIVNVDRVEAGNQRVVSLTDITRLHKYEQELLEKNKQLIEEKEKAEQSDRLKSAFLANVSHEIRTPMNGILGFTNLLMDSDISDTEREEFVRVIQQSGKRMLGTVNDIIDISMIDSGNVKVNINHLSVGKLLNELHKFFLPEARKKKLDFVLHEPDFEQSFHSDTDKINSICTNLIKNAIKFTQEGSIKVSYYFEQNRLHLEVSDTGIGIPHEQQKNIFDRFIQADTSITRKYEGSGLGLSITKSYVEMLQGEMRMRSEPGIGTTFYVSIPNSSDIQDANIKQSAKSTEFALPKDLNILVAEDDLISFKLLKSILDPFAQRIVHASNGKVAIEKVQGDGPWDLVLMDIKMPIIDGLQATRIIRDFNKKLPIIAQTAHARTTDSISAFEVGCNDYISKPIDRIRLLETISRVI